MRKRFDSGSKIGHIRNPIFLTHAGDDELITGNDFGRLMDAISVPNLGLIRPGKELNDPLEPAEIQMMRDFLIRIHCLPER